MRAVVSEQRCDVVSENDTQSLADSLSQFVSTWRRTGAPTADEARRNCELTSPPRASFRPHEVVPRVYLGGIRDVANVGQLQRDMMKESRRRQLLEEQQQPQQQQQQESETLPRWPRLHCVFLIVAVCREIATGDATAVAEQGNVVCPVQLQLRRALSPQEVTACARPQTTTKSPPFRPPRSEPLACYRLDELEARCQEALHDDAMASEAAAQQWWTAFLADPFRKATPILAPVHAAARSSRLYWRLLVPIEDSPDAALRPLFGIISTIMRAALDADVWCGSEAELETTDLDCVSPSHSPALPCVVVHCMAGRSRSATLVMAFLLREWGRALQGRHGLRHGGEGNVPPHRTHADSVTPGSHRATAKELVRLLLRMVQERRPIVSPNDGFYASLEDEAEALVASMCARSHTVQADAKVGIKEAEAAAA